VQTQIYTKFLFKEFLEKYQENFQEQPLVKLKRQNRQKLSLVSFFKLGTLVMDSNSEDQKYQPFLVEILKNLEPNFFITG